MLSEIARLRQQIEEECQALKLVMEGFAVSGSHKAIAARYERMSTYHQGLAHLVGEQADDILLEVYNQVLDDDESDISAIRGFAWNRSSPKIVELTWNLQEKPYETPV